MKAAHKIPWKAPKYTVSVSVHSHYVPVVLIGMFLVADKLYADYQRPDVFVNVIASSCCSNGECKSCHFIMQRPLTKVLYSFAIHSYVLSG